MVSFLRGDIVSHIGRNIMDARQALGMTQEDLAYKVGYKTKSAINKIEKGIRDVPQTKIVAFAEALGTTPAALMGWEEEKVKPKKEIRFDPKPLTDAVAKIMQMCEEDPSLAEDLLFIAKRIKEK